MEKCGMNRVRVHIDCLKQVLIFSTRFCSSANQRAANKKEVSFSFPFGHTHTRKIVAFVRTYDSFIRNRNDAIER